MWKEGNVLFNDALNTFYLRLYGVRKLNVNTVEGRKEGYVLFNEAFNTFLYTVICRRTGGKGPLSVRENQLPQLHRLLFLISRKGSFICTMSQEARSNSVVEHPIMVRWVVGSIPHGQLIELFLVSASAPRLM